MDHRTAARAVRRLPERLLHPQRRRRAERLAAAATGPVLVLCHGNICRSPYAEAVLRRLLEARGVAVSSAGFIGPGRQVPATGRAVASRRGYDVAAHRSRLVSRELAAAAGLVVVMGEAQRARLHREFAAGVPVLVLGDLDPRPIATREILDPFERDEAYFDAVYERIERCAGRLAALLGSACRDGGEPAP